jgi:quinol monooxygenase YgiN
LSEERDQSIEAPTVFVATYLETISPTVAEAAALLRREREATSDDEGLHRFEVLQRMDRPSQFLVLSAWSTPEALEAHRSSQHVSDLTRALVGLLVAPPDSRLHRELATNETTATGATGTSVVTHVDVTPAHKDAAVEALQQLFEHSRSHEGNRRFHVWQQQDRPNHFTLVETWSGSDALEAHLMQTETRAFRRVVAPMLGALYDDRRYQTLD